jgi:hypothetical protein
MAALRPAQDTSGPTLDGASRLPVPTNAVPALEFCKRRRYSAAERHLRMLRMLGMAASSCWSRTSPLWETPRFTGTAGRTRVAVAVGAAAWWASCRRRPT